MDDIKKLVDKIGWKNVILGLARYAQEKKEYMKKQEFYKRAREWEIIEQKIMEIRKNIQM